MDYKQIEQELLDVEQGKILLKNLSKLIAERRHYVETARPASLNKNKVQNSATNKFEEAMIELICLENDFNERLPIILNKETRAIRAISRLSMEEQNILIEKYMHTQKWWELEEIHSYCERQLRRKRDAALKKLVIHGDFLKDH